eukprot:3367896-Prymnesium_polylepis.2
MSWRVGCEGERAASTASACARAGPPHWSQEREEATLHHHLSRSAARESCGHGCQRSDRVTRSITPQRVVGWRAPKLDVLVGLPKVDVGRRTLGDRPEEAPQEGDVPVHSERRSRARSWYMVLSAAGAVLRAAARRHSGGSKARKGTQGTKKPSETAQTCGDTKRTDANRHEPPRADASRARVGRESGGRARKQQARRLTRRHRSRRSTGRPVRRRRRRSAPSRAAWRRPRPRPSRRRRSRAPPP